MAPTYKLYYFNARGAAEPIRFIFAHAGVAYEDIRFTKEEWPALKKDSPQGTVPYLEIDGKKIGQSSAIARYLARKFKLAGKDEWESLECDVIIETLADLKNLLYKPMKEEDPTKKAALLKELTTEKIPHYLSLFEKTIVANKGLTVGSNITWSDLTLAMMLEALERMFQVSLEKYPANKALKEKVYNLPKIAAWIKKRPESEF